MDIDRVERTSRHEARYHRADDPRLRKARCSREGDRNRPEHQGDGKAAADFRVVHEARASKRGWYLGQGDEHLVEVKVL